MDKRSTLKNSNDQQNGTREIAPWKIAPPPPSLNPNPNPNPGKNLMGAIFRGDFPITTKNTLSSLYKIRSMNKFNKLDQQTFDYLWEMRSVIGNKLASF